MKRILLIFALICLSLSQALADDDNGKLKQDPVVRGGILLSGNMYKMNTNYDFITTQKGYGTDCGGYLDFNVTQHFFFRSFVIFAWERTVLSNTQTQSPMKLSQESMAISIYPMFRFRLSPKTGLFFGIGPSTGFVVNGNIHTDGEADANPYEQVAFTDEETGVSYFQLNSSHFYLGGNLGLMLNNRILVEAQLQLGIVSILGFQSDSHWVYPAKCSFGIGYMF